MTGVQTCALPISFFHGFLPWRNPTGNTTKIRIYYGLSRVNSHRFRFGTVFIAYKDSAGIELSGGGRRIRTLDRPATELFNLQIGEGAKGRPIGLEGQRLVAHGGPTARIPFAPRCNIRSCVLRSSWRALSRHNGNLIDSAISICYSDI